MAQADDFTTGANRVLERSRIHFTWAACGIMAGAFEAALKYSRERIQFGKPIAGFQLTQEKLVRCLGEI
jgi:glutaryl-CoA dehydrogenase